MTNVSTRASEEDLAAGLSVAGAGLEGNNLAGASASLALFLRTDRCNTREVMHGFSPDILSSAAIGAASASAIAPNKELPCHYASA